MDFNGDIPGVYPTIYMGLSENDTSELAWSGGETMMIYIIKTHFPEKKLQRLGIVEFSNIFSGAGQKYSDFISFIYPSDLWAHHFVQRVGPTICNAGMVCSDSDSHGMQTQTGRLGDWETAVSKSLRLTGAFYVGNGWEWGCWDDYQLWLGSFPGKTLLIGFGLLRQMEDDVVMVLNSNSWQMRMRSMAKFSSFRNSQKAVVLPVPTRLSSTSISGLNAKPNFWDGSIPW